jgi:hypothetical protein
VTAPDSQHGYVAETGDEQTVSALSLPREDAQDEHTLILRDPDGRIGRYWECTNCGRFFMNPTVFESETCIPWGKR